MDLNFVILYVRDLEKAKNFYTQALGMTVIDAFSGPTFVTVRPVAGSMIGLQDKMASKLPPHDEEHAGTVELSFAVDNVDDTWKRWKENGVELVTDPMDLPFGRYFMAKDLDGHYLSAYRFTLEKAVSAESTLQAS